MSEKIRMSVSQFEEMTRPGPGGKCGFTAQEVSIHEVLKGICIPEMAALVAMFDSALTKFPDPEQGIKNLGALSAVLRLIMEESINRRAVGLSKLDKARLSQAQMRLCKDRSRFEGLDEVDLFDDEPSQNPGAKAP